MDQVPITVATLLQIIIKNQCIVSTGLLSIPQIFQTTVDLLEKEGKVKDT